MYSLRRTVAVRFSVTIFVALLLIALWAYLGARQILQEALDNNLTAAAQLESAVLASRLPIAMQPGPSALDSFISTVNRFVAVRDSSATVVETNSPLASDLPLHQESFERARAGDTVWVTERWSQQQLRSYYGPIPHGSRSQYAVVQISASLGPLHDATRRVLFLMLGTVLLGTVATALGAGWLAGRAVVPVLEITEQARSIQPGRGQRITAHADVQEFAGLVAVLNDVLVRLERAFDAQRRMIADAGHDLRTPLTVMRGELEVALRGERRPEEYRLILSSVLEEVDHLTSISESLALLARLEAGELTLQRVESDVGALMSDAVTHTRARAGSRVLEYEPPADEPVAMVDTGMLGIAIRHVLDNAIVHTPEETRVTAGVELERGILTIVVDDSGPGMSSEAMEQLFQHFYRSDGARSRTGCAGLGLTIAAAIVQAHGGTIVADKSPLGGLRITFRIPVMVSGH
ncbi:MAG: HAMP domain-containing histidine kinase [Gemmatimonadota bacterium]|nr:HAMP domain-containing histidine kinase [Gemmatimonadota bacterium]